ncbi:MAG: DUF1566 domain-containing protein [Gammaproteobacteria bacterium]|nr:DUF1566 domain-containing protein [Gammaproteobacteria bacterium]
MLHASLLLAVLVLPTSTMAAQICRTDTTQTTLSSAFTIASDGTVTDHANQLQWQRCPLGLEGDRCEGKIRLFSWMAAHDAVARLNRDGVAGHHDWRLPSKQELATLVTPHCVNPAIDLNTFPNTPSAWFWTASSEDGGTHAAWYVNFDVGQSHIDDRNLPNAVRLVRTLPPVPVLTKTAPAGAVQ